MRERILEELRKIEEVENVRVLLAVETGSRAWGFASPDSDYDVRFIYMRNTEVYLKLKPVRDVIEWKLDETLDINGWDLKKALQLLHGSNPTIFEWCASPIVYLEREEFSEFRKLLPEYFSVKKSLFHYWHMAESNYRKYLKEDMVRVKKYLYVLRPLLAAKWVQVNRTAPPMLFDELLDAVLEEVLRLEVDKLLILKKSVPEIGLTPRIQLFNDYIEKTMQEIKEAAEKVYEEKSDWEPLDRTFLKVLR